MQKLQGSFQVARMTEEQESLQREVDRLTGQLLEMQADTPEAVVITSTEGRDSSDGTAASKAVSNRLGRTTSSQSQPTSSQCSGPVSPGGRSPHAAG